MKLDMGLTSLGEATSAADWVKQNREAVERSKRQAEERRRQYDEALGKDDDEDEDEKPKSKKARAQYGSSDLQGLQVMHSTRAWEEGEEVILTLADTAILATDEYGKVTGINEEDADVLENVNLAEADRREDRQQRSKRLTQPLYSGYDDDEFVMGVAPGAKRSLLAHYDKDKKAGPQFSLGEGGAAQLTADPAPSSSNSNGRAYQSLQVQMKPATAFMTRKGGRAKGASRIRVREQEDEEVREEEQGDYDLADILSAPTVPASSSAAAMDVDEEVPRKAVTAAQRPARPMVQEQEADDDLTAALAAARALAVRRNLQAKDKEDLGAKAVLEVVRAAPEEVQAEDGDMDSEGRTANGSIVFNSTVEFATRLQATLSERARVSAETAVREAERAVDAEGPRDEVPSAEDVGPEDMEDDEESSDESMDEEEDEDDQLGFLHDQPLASKGMGAALSLLRGTGDLKASQDLAGRAKDSRGVDPSSVEKGVTIEYRDDFGRKLTQKEAFRQLSYRFHGHGPGKKKMEKRLKAMAVQNAAASSRTGVLEGAAGTMKSLTTAQAATGQAHVVVQGGVHSSQQQIASMAAAMTAKAAAKAAAKAKKAKKHSE